jgi:hypothetical protein
MKRSLIGIAIAAVVLYFYGFLIWGGVIPYGEHIWRQAADDASAAKALREHFPEARTYVVPAATSDPEIKAALHEEGPIVMLHVLSADGRPEFDPMIMAKGFAVNLAFIIAVALLLQQVVAALPTYTGRVTFAALAGLACTLLTDIGDIAWWEIDWQWKLYTGAYHLTAWIIVAIVLAAFIRPRTAVTG